jgi:hypothetical protein
MSRKAARELKDLDLSIANLRIYQGHPAREGQAVSGRT